MKKLVYLLCSLAFLAQAGSVLASVDDNHIGWKLDDNAANTTVTGVDWNAILVGGNTSDVATTLNGRPMFHLDGSTQYVRVTIPKIWPSATTSAITSPWIKSAGNPIIAGPAQFGQITPNPLGGYYFFGSDDSDIYRWSCASNCTVTASWGSKTKVLARAAGAWDDQVQVASVFQRLDSTALGEWVMLYRGFLSGGGGIGGYQMGLATTTDSSSFTRKNNGGTNDGLIALGQNFDPTGVLWDGATYYLFVSGDNSHGIQNLYTTTDFITFTAVNSYPNSTLFPYGTTNPVSNNYCAGVWKIDNYYYALIPTDIATGHSIGDHYFSFYRSTSPDFAPNHRTFLGYPITNDQSYDIYYLDTPTAFTTGATGNYASEFGSTFNFLYSGSSVSTQSQNLASTTFEAIRQYRPKFRALSYEEQSYSFWLQFDSLSTGEAIISVGNTPSDSAPNVFYVVRGTSPYYFAAYTPTGYVLDTTPLAVDTRYFITLVHRWNGTAFVEDLYINGKPTGTTFATRASTLTEAKAYIYLGTSYNGAFLDGYIGDFRIYPRALTATEVQRLYGNGNVLLSSGTVMQMGNQF